VIKRYIGELEIRLQYCGRTSDNRAKYLGNIVLPDGRKWNFADLQSGVGCPGTRPEDFDEMAESAVSFATYYTSHNRGDDTPDWAPPAELADAIEEASYSGMAEDSGYIVLRKREG